MDNDTDLIALFERLINNTLALIAIIIAGGAYLVYRFVPNGKRKTGEHVKAKPSDLIEVIYHLSKSQAIMSENQAKMNEIMAKHPDLFATLDNRESGD